MPRTPRKDAGGRTEGDSSPQTRPPVSGVDSVALAVRRDAVLECSSDAIALLDASGCASFANAAARALFGWTLEDLAGGRALLATSLDDPSDEELSAWLAGAVAASPDADQSLQLRVRRDASAEARLVAATLRNAIHDSRLGGLVLNARDVTHEHSRWSTSVRAQRLETVGLLAGGLAHDFNNILAIIVASASNLFEGDDLSTREDAEAILAASARATLLTKKLSGFISKETVEPRVIHLERHLADARPLLAQAVDGVALELAVDSSLPPVLADPTELDHVIMNLVANAADALPRRIVVGAGARRIMVPEHDSTGALVGAGDYVALWVEDDGKGMTIAVRDRIFEPFFTTKAAPADGPGLGLTTVYGVVKRHAGGLYVESEPDRGTRLTVLWRIAPDNKEPAREHEGGGEPPLVIIVDDEPAIARGVARLLQRRGYRTVTCTNGPDALQAIRVAPRGDTILLSDVVMPQMGGLELAEEARRLVPDLPVLLMSGFTGTQDVSKSGFQIIAKPFDPQALVDRLTALSPRGPISDT